MRGPGTGQKAGRRPQKTQPNVVVGESESVDVREDGEISTKVTEMVRDPITDQMQAELVEVPGVDNDVLMYLDYESGATIDEISHKYRIPPIDAQRKVDAAHARLVEELESGNGAKLRQLHDKALKRIEGIALREFAKSQGQRKRVTKRVGVVGNKETDVTETMSEDSQPGDPRYLNVALRCRELQANLWGIEAPKRVEHTHTVTLNVEDMSEEDLQRLADANRAIKRLQVIDAEFQRKT